MLFGVGYSFVVRDSISIPLFVQNILKIENSNQLELQIITVQTNFLF